MRAMRLALASVWVAVAVGLMVRPVGGWSVVGPPLALALAALNLVRWRADRPRPVAEQRPHQTPSGEYHPEFDFGVDPGPTKSRS